MIFQIIFSQPKRPFFVLHIFFPTISTPKNLQSSASPFNVRCVPSKIALQVFGMGLALWWAWKIQRCAARIWDRVWGDIHQIDADGRSIEMLWNVIVLVKWCKKKAELFNHLHPTQGQSYIQFHQKDLLSNASRFHFVIRLLYATHSLQEALILTNRHIITHLGWIRSLIHRWSLMHDVHISNMS